MRGILSRRNLLLGALVRGTAQEVTFSTSVELVTLLATVRNRDGGIVKDLNQEDFLLEEDGRPQTIRYFSREFNVPLTLGLLVDTSRSQLHVLEPERKASYAFLDRMLREDDQAFVASFDINVQMLQGLTNSRELLSVAMDRLRIYPSAFPPCCSMLSIKHPTTRCANRKAGKRSSCFPMASMLGAILFLPRPSNLPSVPIR